MERYCLCALIFLSTAVSAQLPEDPLASPLWKYTVERYLGKGANVVLDERVQLFIPDFAEDSTQVPLSIDLARFPHEVKKVVAWIDMNPVPLLFSVDDIEPGLRLISLNFRVQQASSVRAAVMDGSGTWHIDSKFVEAAGGGCTAPREVMSNADWDQGFGELRTGLFPRDGNTRVKVNLLHPMDSGMAGNVPAFFVQEVELRSDESDTIWLTMKLAESAAQNPMFVFEFDGQISADTGTGSNSLHIRMNDNNGYRFEGAIGKVVSR